MNIYKGLIPEHKIRVFISSMCGDDCPIGPSVPVDNNQVQKNYVLIRRELQALLESTGLFEVYNFDTDTASSGSTTHDYTSNLDEANLVVFLIDNADGISEGVRIEERRARSKPQTIKRLYLFCNQYSDKKTDFQTNLEGASPDSEPKYLNVSNFVEMGEKAYQSIMADLIKHYKAKDDVQRKQLDTINEAQAAANSVNVLNANGQNLVMPSADVGASYDEINNNRNLIAASNLTHEENNRGSSFPQISVDEKNTSIKVDDSKNTHKIEYFALDKKLYEAPRQIGKYLESVLLTGKYKNQDKSAAVSKSSSITELSLKLLSSLIGKSAFDIDSFDELSSSIVNRQIDPLKPVVKERLKSVKASFTGDLESALMHERKAFEMASSVVALPYWFLNDIAIDIRNLINMNAKNKGDYRTAFNPSNEGQEIIDNSIETVYYPLLDRTVSNFEESVIEKYEKNYRQSPYTVTLGSGLDSVFNNIGSAFWIALLNGSYTQLEITNHRLITALNMITNIYDDHVPVVEMVRLIFIQNEKIKDNIDAILRTYHGDADLLDADEAESIYQSIEWMPVQVRREQSEYEFFAIFSCYCSDEFFTKNIGRIIDGTLRWAKDKGRDFWNSEDKYRFYDGLNTRDLPEKWIEFVITLFDNISDLGVLSSVSSDICKHIRNLDYTTIDEAYINRLLDYLIPLGDNTGKRKAENISDNNPYLMDVLLKIVLLLPSYKERIINGLNDAPLYERNRFALELEVSNYKNDKNLDIYKYIHDLLISAESHAKNTQNGAYSEGTNYYGVIRNIIENSKIELTTDQANEIVRYALKFLKIQSETVAQKISCCQVLELIITRYSDLIDKESLCDYMEKSTDEFTLGNSKELFSKDSSAQLKCAYLLLLISGGYKGNDELIDLLYTIGNNQEYEKIKFLDILTQSMKIDEKNKFTKAVLNTICNFTLLVSNSNERETLFFCVQCLIELTRYTATSNTALRRLMAFMDGNNAQIRLATVARVKNARFKDNAYVDAIMAKAKVDNYYLVRKMALE